MKKLIIAIVLAAVVGCALGYAVGYFRGGSDIAASYAVKIAAVNKLFPAPLQTLSLNGRVDNVSGETITVDVNPITINPFAEGNFPAVRTVTVTDATVITRMGQKDPVVLQKEMAAFQKATQSGSVLLPVGTGTALAAIVPPMPFSETAMALSDIKAGDMVTVTAASDILSVASFSATKIQVTPAATSTPIANPATLPAAK